MAVGDDLAVSVQLTEAVRELAERNEPGTVDVRDRMLVPLAHVDHEELGVTLPLFLQLLRSYLRAVVQRLGTDAAKRFVVDRRGDRGVAPTDGAIGVFLQLQLAELKLERVEQHQASDERLAHTQDELDRLHGLDRPDNAGQHTQYSSFRTGRDEPRRWRLR